MFKNFIFKAIFFWKIWHLKLNLLVTPVNTHVDGRTKERIQLLLNILLPKSKKVNCEEHGRGEREGEYTTTRCGMRMAEECSLS